MSKSIWLDVSEVLRWNVALLYYRMSRPSMARCNDRKHTIFLLFCLCGFVIMMWCKGLIRAIGGVTPWACLSWDWSMSSKPSRSCNWYSITYYFATVMCSMLYLIKCCCFLMETCSACTAIEKQSFISFCPPFFLYDWIIKEFYSSLLSGTCMR